jgi:hypothetical protein
VEVLARLGELATSSEQQPDGPMSTEAIPAVAGEQLAGEPFALCPAAKDQQAVGNIDSHIAAHGTLEAEVAGALVALLGVRKGPRAPGQAAVVNLARFTSLGVRSTSTGWQIQPA